MHRSRFVDLCFPALIAAALSACADPASPQAARRDVEALFQTDSLSYALIDNGTSYYGLIAARFTNQSGGATYFVNCNGVTSYQFEKLVDGVWKVTFAPPINLCLSPPVVVANGATHEWRI